MPTTEINADAEFVTLINVFTVEPDRQRELVDVLARATEEVMRHQPGFVSANLHVGLDGTRVANYAQWESAEHFQRMLANPECRQHMAAATAIARAEPALYSVDSVRHA
ncbi:antibiotic biosynthesis monooxygenase [Saccharopolyspora erythraea NRRL 2338]|uniref:Antibiotic biosynthesis monooxygenase n=2 Tax=Saccharopolyspora erythraea TaxID=1836 RepID=A4FAS8_SACEN|nr:antibiotic biosynthesis monooxygenase family protein [Saccharopolyspora erythraea]EQD81970.1 antibiotic biosynthesis monooxygenase [Saccharopolyspora erythraea D]PFG94935.1 antibiotic biosynthesis monooxygenase [Saccharopolyspora erythraea NRRL 2338]QRK91630.1 antibiotic biosynthesis monooxygenase [Saccharopolyspora erythraea]CAM01153.1 antibiotic biosynthesis monooxygenase [Saccharopolyspora erythraea NRRL 2338]